MLATASYRQSKLTDSTERFDCKPTHLGTVGITYEALHFPRELLRRWYGRRFAHIRRNGAITVTAKKPNWDDAASEILTEMIPLLLKAGGENGVSLTDLGTFRSAIASIIREEALENRQESA